jgi:hypothetical protein
MTQTTNPAWANEGEPTSFVRREEAILKSGQRKPGSWIIIDETNKPIYETFNEKEAELINRKKKYRAIPAMEYLCALNKSTKEGTA